jgi:thioredoxin-related protein
MKNRVVLALAALLVFGAASSSLAEVHFKDLSFDAAKKLALKEKKKIMVDFYTDWCGWCKVLDRKTYSDEAVGKAADANFISIKIDAEKGEGVALAKQFQISGYPTILFLSADGKEIDRVVGYQDASRFERSLSLAASGGTKAILDEVSAKKDLKDARKILIAAEYYEEHHDEAKALELFRQASAIDGQNEKHIREEADFHAAFLTKGEEQWTALESAVKQYPDRTEGQQATLMLLQHAFQTDHAEQDAGRLTEFWISRHPDDVNVMNYFAWGAAEKGILLDQAEEMATRAVAAAQAPTERASIMDTRAEVLFKRNRVQEAVEQEREAMQMLDPVKDKKLYTSLSAQKAKFEAALAAGGAAGTPVPPSAARQ